MENTNIHNDTKKVMPPSRGVVPVGVPVRDHTDTDSASARNISNDQRRRSIWRSEDMAVTPQPRNSSSTVGTRQHDRIVHGRDSTFLTEKQLISGRSIRRITVSPRRSMLSTSQHSASSARSALNEKNAIAHRSQRRMDARKASSYRELEESNASAESIPVEVADYPKAGTAEMILNTVSELSDTDAALESSHQASHSAVATPTFLSDRRDTPSTYPSEVVTAIALNDDDIEAGFQNELPLAAEVVEVEQPYFRRLPVLLCFALVFLVLVNTGGATAVLSTRDRAAKSSDTLDVEETWPTQTPSRNHQDIPEDQDSQAQPLLAPRQPPSLPPTQMPLHNGRPTTSLSPTSSPLAVPVANGRPRETTPPSEYPTQMPSTHGSLVPTSPTTETSMNTEQPSGSSMTESEVTVRQIPILYTTGAPTTEPASTQITYFPTLEAASSLSSPTTTPSLSPTSLLLVWDTKDKGIAGSSNGNGNGNGSSNGNSKGNANGHVP